VEDEDEVEDKPDVVDEIEVGPQPARVTVKTPTNRIARILRSMRIAPNEPRLAASRS